MEYLQWMVQVCGENLGANATAGDFINWARGKGMNPAGGWQLNAVLTKEVLAQTLVQLFNINPRKQGGDYSRILEREGIVLPSAGEISRQVFVAIVDDPGFGPRIPSMRDFSPVKGNNGVGNGIDPAPPGNPPMNDGPGTSPGNPGNKGGVKKGQMH
jgi:hypothetical protein